MSTDNKTGSGTRPIPQAAIDSLPDGYVLLGWGGDFKDLRNQGCFYFCKSDTSWHRRCGDNGFYSENDLYAAPTDSEIVKLSKPWSASAIHDKVREAGLDNAAPTSDPKGSNLLPTSDELRQQYLPLSWLLEYFPNAQLQCAKFSCDNNKKHTGKIGMEWARDKSIGDGNQLVRHLMEGMHYAKLGEDKDALYHLTAVAWRGLELLERYMNQMEPFNELD